MLGLLATLTLFAQGEGEVQLSELSLSAKFWVSGTELFLRVRRPFSYSGKPEGLAEALKKQIGSILVKSQGKEFRPKFLQKTLSEGGMVDLAFDSGLVGIPPGPAEVYLERGKSLVGPLKIEILKVAPKVDFEKAAPAQLAATGAALVTTHGWMLLEFFPDKAPLAVRNFLKLSAKGFYDGSPFHRILKDFMIQGGDPTGTGMGDAGYTLKAEFTDVKHEKGVISMARSDDPDSASCQFFIVHGAHASHLDGQYTAFGKLLDGLETLDKIASVAVEMGDGGEPSRPKAPVILNKVILVDKPASGGEAGKK